MMKIERVEVFGVEVPLSDFFRSPTVTHLGRVVDEAVTAATSDEQLLALIERLPEEQAARLLDASEEGEE